MKRITFLGCLLLTAIGFSQTLEVVEDFEGIAVVAFVNGNGTATIVNDPETGGTRGNVLEIITAAAQAPWQQAEITILDTTMDLTTNKTVEIDVYSDTPFSMLARASEPTEPAVADSAADAAHTGSGWETLTFNFNNPKDQLAVANGFYTKIFLFNNWDTAIADPRGGTGYWACTDGAASANPCPSRTSFVDNIKAVPGPAAETPDLPSAPAPTPLNYTTHLALFDNITDSGPFTMFWNPDDFFGAAPTIIDLDATGVVNNTAQINLSIGWGGGLSADGNFRVTDLSAYDTFHFDYYVPSNIDAGSLGHQFYIDFIDRILSSEINSEAFYGVGIGPGNPNIDGGSSVIDQQMVFDNWVGVDIPMTTLIAKGFDPSIFFQIKIGASSDLRTQVGYFDNLYFYDSTTLGTDEFASTEFKVFPNPTKNNWNIKSNTTISTIAIYDILGKQVKTLAPNATDVEISTANITAGIYFARIDGISGSKTVKLIKE